MAVSILKSGVPKAGKMPTLPNHVAARVSVWTRAGPASRSVSVQNLTIPTFAEAPVDKPATGNHVRTDAYHFT